MACRTLTMRSARNTALTENELALASSRPSIHAQVYCILQIGYFKAKNDFFRFYWRDVEDDCAFVLSRYFQGEAFETKQISKHEHYSQRGKIAALFGYQPWASSYLPSLEHQASLIVRRDVTPNFVAAELIVWLNEQKIIRPAIPPCKRWSAKSCPLNVDDWEPCLHRCWMNQPRLP